jgi:hypothetical protein
MQEQYPSPTESKKVCSLSFDTTEITAQLDDLEELPESRFPEGVPSQILSDLSGLGLDVVFTDSRTAPGANGALEIFQALRLARSFERFRTTVLALEGDVHEGCSLSL